MIHVRVKSGGSRARVVPLVRTSVAQPKYRRDGIGRNVLDHLGANDGALIMEDLFSVIAITNGAHRKAALDASIEDALALPDRITKLFVLRPPTPDRDRRDIEGFSEVLVGRAATTESMGERRELAPVLRGSAAWMFAAHRARHAPHGDPT